MTDPQIRFDELMAALKERDFRLTPQRVELVQLIAASEGHPSAAQLYASVSRRFPTMSQATVYKTLALLKDMGQVLEIDLREDSRYDGNRPQPHPHLICTQCNKVIDGDADLDPLPIKKLERATGYKIFRSQVTFYGLCPDCKKENA
jgi:Fur family transcriptional regulator, peroxide stress response regulator